jgi:hypothetical protein
MANEVGGVGTHHDQQTRELDLRIDVDESGDRWPEFFDSDIPAFGKPNVIAVHPLEFPTRHENPRTRSNVLRAK